MVEWQILCVRTLERHAVGAEVLRRYLQHQRIKVRGYDVRLRDRQPERACHDACACGGLEDSVRLKESRSPGDDLRIGLEQQRPMYRL